MVLSDSTIQAHLKAGRLVEGGAPGSAGPCSYDFTAGKIITGGDDPATIDWTTPPRNAIFVIKPGAMVWVRMRERVNLPADICATWWQTNTLSRKGIMLVNMSVVDPGYEGPLACLFVNFGRLSVPIDPATIVAKLLFHELDRPAVRPFVSNATDAEYDRSLLETAMLGPASFLNVAQLSPELAAQKEKILTEISDDAPKYLRKAIGAAALGFILLVGALSFVPWLQSKISPNLGDSVARIVDERLIQRLNIQSIPARAAINDSNPAQTATILQRLDALEHRGLPPSGHAP